jgi:oligoendopeptidase F
MGLLFAVLCAIDFQRHFYASKKAVDAERAAIHRDIEVLRKSPDDTRTYDDLLVRSERLLAYLYLQYSIDTTNIAARDDEEALSVEVAEITRRVSLPNVPWQKKSRDEMAAELIALTKSGNEYARAHGYADAAEAAYAQNGWTKSDVESLLARVERYRPQYEEYRSTRKKLEPPRQFSVDDARETILTSIHALPAAFRVEMRRLLDPEEQRIDMAPGPNRRRGAFSKGFPGTTSVVFMSGFTGAYNDMRALMHEGTHAVHRQLQARGRVRPRYANGPKWILEATAVFAEMLLADTLARKTGEAFYAQQFLEG